LTLITRSRFESTRPAEGDLQTCNDCRLESANNTAAVGIQPSDAENLEPGEWSLHRQLMDLNDNCLAESTQPLESSLQTRNDCCLVQANNMTAGGLQPCDTQNLKPGDWSSHRQLMDLNDNCLAESTQPLESSLQTCNNSLFESANNTAAVGILPSDAGNLEPVEWSSHRLLMDFNVSYLTDLIIADGHSRQTGFKTYLAEVNSAIAQNLHSSDTVTAACVRRSSCQSQDLFDNNANESLTSLNLSDVLGDAARDLLGDVTFMTNMSELSFFRESSVAVSDEVDGTASEDVLHITRFPGQTSPIGVLESTIENFEMVASDAYLISDFRSGASEVTLFASDEMTSAVAGNMNEVDVGTILQTSLIEDQSPVTSELTLTSGSAVIGDAVNSLSPMNQVMEANELCWFYQGSETEIKTSGSVQCERGKNRLGWNI
jgi:hypothetical protein